MIHLHLFPFHLRHSFVAAVDCVEDLEIPRAAADTAVVDIVVAVGAA